MMADTLAQVHREQAQSTSKYCRDWAVHLTGEKWSRCRVAFTFSCFNLGKWQELFLKRGLLVSKTLLLVKNSSRERTCSDLGTEKKEVLMT